MEERMNKSTDATLPWRVHESIERRKRMDEDMQTFPQEVGRTEQMRMYIVSYHLVYADLLGHYPYAHSFGFSNDQGAVEWADSYIKENATMEGVVGVHSANVREIRWYRQPGTTGIGLPDVLGEEPLVLQETIVATFGDDHKWTLHR